MKRKVFCVILTILLILPCCGAASAEGCKPKYVRVGYCTEDERFQSGASDKERRSGYAYEYYQAISSITGWYYEYVYCTREEVKVLLESGDIDIAAGFHAGDSGNFLLSKYDMGDSEDAPSYFGVSASRPELLDTLNDAMEQIARYSPDLPFSLRQKYYSQTADQELTAREKEWLAEKGELRIGFVFNNLPLSDGTDMVSPTGLVKDLIIILGEYMHIDMVPVGYVNFSEMENGLSRGEIDAAFPTYSDLWLAESKGFIQTEAFVRERVMIVYNGSYTDTLLDRIALAQTGVGQRYYLAAYYPDSEIVYYDTRTEAFDALMSGDEQCILGSSGILQYFFRTHSEYEGLNVAYLDTSENFGISVNRECALLAGILNKAIRQIDSATITGLMTQYSAIKQTYTLKNFLEDYSIVLMVVLISFFAILLSVFISYFRKTKKFNEEQENSRRELEKAYAAAKVASDAKTNFLSSMSHDIRTPMNAIVGMTEIAVRHIDDSERVRDCLDKIELSGHYLMTLINNVLDISKIESGKMGLNPVEFSIRETMFSIINIVQPQVKAKSLDLRAHIHGIEHETLYADEVRLNQVFLNLLTNAVKYTPDGGSVTVELSEELLPDDKAEITFIVSDTGIGMSPEFMENMYDVFSRAQDTRTNKIQGTGLGLAIVKQIVEMHGGTIACDSKEGSGTTFTVKMALPISDEDEEKPMLPQLRLLLVDDDEIFLECSSVILRDIGAIPDVVDNGAAAVDMVREAHNRGDDYDAVIVDWKMPETDGVETIKEMRAIVGDDMPIFLSSAFDVNELEGTEKEYGASGFVCKPLFRSYIYEKLSAAVRQSGTAAADDRSDGEEFKGMRLLVAEDNELNWEVVSSLLEVYGISTDWAQNGKVCVDMLSSAPPDTYDMVLMDIQMPVMNGREAAEAIRGSELSYVRNIPIIATTADAFAEDITASIEAGMNGHVSKPIDMSVLCQEMRKVMKNRRR